MKNSQWRKDINFINLHVAIATTITRAKETIEQTNNVVIEYSAANLEQRSLNP